MTLPDLARFDRVAIDTETTGVAWDDVPIGFSWATPDGARGYHAWGHEGGGNNTSLDEVRAWARVELTRPPQLKIFYNQPFDARMLDAVGIQVAGPCEDASILGPLLDENDPVGFSLDAQAKKYLGETKSDEYLNEWCAAQFGGRALRQAQAKNYWRVPYGVMQEYAERDPVLTLRYYDLRRPEVAAQDLEAVYRLETRLLPILQRMRKVGARVDRPGTRAAIAQLNAQLGVDADGNRTGGGLLGEWDVATGGGVNPLSTDQVAPIFERAYKIVVKRTALGNYSIEKVDLERWADEGHHLATLNLRIRETSKLAGTFITSQLLGYIDGDDLIHCEFHQLPSVRGGARTGRFSASDPNLQFFPGDRFPDAQRLIRSLLVPYHAGQAWYKADYSQIEYRFLAHYAGGVLAERYAAEPNVDFHEMLTRLVYPAAELVDPTVFKARRRRTKNTNFAIVYGAGLKRAAETAGVSTDEMKGVLERYHTATGGLIKRLQDKAMARANQRGYIVTWGGRRLRFMSAADARAKGWKVYPNERFVGTYKALNYLLQGSAADLIKRAMVAAAEIVDWQNTHLHLTVHDELGFSGPPPKSAAGRAFARQLHETMAEQFVLSSGVPIRVEIGAGPSWGETASLESEG